MFNKAAFNAKVETWLNEQISKSVVKELTECYDLMDKDSPLNIFRVCKKQLNAVRSKIVLSYVKVFELVVLVYK